MDLKQKAVHVCQLLQDEGYEAYLVGGCVRDMILGREPKDYDITTNASADKIKLVFLGKYPTLEIGAAFGIITVIVDGDPFEIATYRSERGTIDGRHPEEITFVSDIKEDLSRRDYDMNAIALDPLSNIFVDPHHGYDSIINRRIRFVGYPKDRIKEDHLRILRAYRFASTLGFDIDKESEGYLESAISQGDCLKGVSNERIAEEFRKILIGDNALEVIEKMVFNGLLWKIIPELEYQIAPHNCPKWHTETWPGLGNSILAHTMNVFHHAVERSKGKNPDWKFIVRATAIFHDLGKSACRENRGDHDRFLGHDKVGADLTRKRLTFLKYKNDWIDPIVAGVRFHMNVHDLQKSSKPEKLRRFIGQKYFDYILEIGINDTLGTLNEQSPEPDYTNLMNKVNEVRTKYPVLLPPGIISGNDIIAEGYIPSPHFSKALEIAYSDQLRGQTDKKKLINAATAYLRTQNETNRKT
jgi:putative nucleotidyltransferase with HDIG domain